MSRRAQAAVTQMRSKQTYVEDMIRAMHKKQSFGVLVTIPDYELRAFMDWFVASDFTTPQEALMHLYRVTAINPDGQTLRLSEESRAVLGMVLKHIGSETKQFTARLGQQIEDTLNSRNIDWVPDGS